MWQVYELVGIWHAAVGMWKVACGMGRMSQWAGGRCHEMCEGRVAIYARVLV